MALQPLSVGTMNPKLKNVGFPWPSLVVDMGNDLEARIKNGEKFVFPNVIHCHAGDPHSMGQRPISFFQQALSLCLNPCLMEDDRLPSDVKQRVGVILENCKNHGVGAYSESVGLDVVRKQIAYFIEQRDGIPSDFRNIFLSNGVTDGVKLVLTLFNQTSNCQPPGIVIPIPQYPLFSAAISELGMRQINYYLDEDNGWDLDIEELERSIGEARMCSEPRVLVVINPGNPGGFVMSRERMEQVIKLAYKEHLFLLVDEVYQFNVYEDDFKFYSFKKVLTEMGAPYCDQVELASFMSASKGYMGECGARGGFCEIINLDPKVRKMMWKTLYTRLCPNLIGQSVLYCITNPPEEWEPSYEKFIKEKTAVLASLKARAQCSYEFFSRLEGYSCKKIVGGMYAFPRLHLPEKVLQEAKEAGVEPDDFYAMKLLESTGVCVLPGNQFGQKPGTYHFRMTFLPNMDRIKEIFRRIEKFQNVFLEEFR